MSDPAIIPETPGGGTPVENVPAVVEPVAQPSLLSEARPAEPVAAPEPVVEAAPADPVVPPAEPVVPAVVEPPAPVVPPVVPVAPPEPEPIVYEAYEAPEGLTLAAERVQAIDEKLAAARVPPELRNDLYNEHVAEMRRLDEHYQREQWRVFNEQQRAEQEKVQADPELWRPGLELQNQPVIGASLRMLDEFVPATQRGEWDKMMTATGLGNQHIFIKFLSNLAKKFDAPASPMPPANPAPDRGRNPTAKGKLRQFYDAPSSRQS